MGKQASGGSEELQPYEWEGREEYLTRLLSHLQYGETGSLSHLEAMHFLEEVKASAIQQFANGLVEKKVPVMTRSMLTPKYMDAVPVLTIQAAAKAVQEGGR